MSITAEKIARILNPHAMNAYDFEHGRPLDGVGPATASEIEDCLRKSSAILSLLQQGEPEGWKLVPVEPTVEQLEAMPSLPAIKLPVPENLKHLRPHQYQNRERYLAALSASPLPPAPGAETGEKKPRIDRDWCIEAAKREEAAGDPDCSVGTFLAATPPAEGEAERIAGHRPENS